MDKKLNSIKLIVEDIQNQVINKNNYLESIKSENIKKLSKIIGKLICEKKSFKDN